MTPRRYRKRPVEIDAAQFDGTLECAVSIVEWIKSGSGRASVANRMGRTEDEIERVIVIQTLEGSMDAHATYDEVIDGI